MRPPLHVVTPGEDPEPVETVAQRIRSLQAEARRLALEDSRGLAADLAALHARAAEIHAGGEAYPAGIRSVARDVLLACESSRQTLKAILGKVR